MAAVRSGRLNGFSPLVSCLADPHKRKIWGVDTISASAVGGGKWVEGVCCGFSTGGIQYKFYRHPELFIPEYLHDFVSEYDYVKQYGTKIDYHERTAQWIEASGIYERNLGAMIDGR